MASKLRIATFNIQGSNNGQPLLANLLHEMDIFVVQEHWLSDCNFRALENINDDFEDLAVTVMKQNSILIGRP